MKGRDQRRCGKREEKKERNGKKETTNQSAMGPNVSGGRTEDNKAGVHGEWFSGKRSNNFPANTVATSKRRWALRGSCRNVLSASPLLKRRGTKIKGSSWCSKGGKFVGSYAEPPLEQKGELSHFSLLLGRERISAERKRKPKILQTYSDSHPNELLSSNIDADLTVDLGFTSELISSRDSTRKERFLLKYLKKIS